jgi:transcriptional regulator with GAF, ATPase, and Fis domain
VRSSVALGNERALSRLVRLAVPVLGDLGAIDLVQDKDAVIRTRRPALVDHDTEADLEAIAQNAEQLALFRQLEQKSWIIVPLVVREPVLGAMTLAITEIQTAL